MKKNLLYNLVFGTALLAVTVPLRVEAQAGVIGGFASIVGQLLFGSAIGVTDIAASVIGWVALAVNTIISFFGAFFVMFSTWLIEIVLQLSQNIVNTPVVKFGFETSLSIVNLGFILAIIVIAIATILRFQSYGMKQTLWRLVAAALLVNFSLTIAATILNFSDSLTKYFLAGVGSGSPASFATTLAGSFNPQKFLVVSGTDVESVDRTLEGMAAVGGQSFAKLVVPVVTTGFTIIMLIIINITLLGVFVMLLIRYITLSILLVLVPFAWLFWIFPIGLQQYWSQWWKTFIRWAFFAPIAVFFLFLAMKAQALMGSDPSFAAFQTQFSSTSVNPLIATISNFLGNTLSGIIAPAAQMLVVAALTIGGLFAANKLGIASAGAAYGMAVGASKGFGAYLGRRGVQLGTAPMRGRAGQEAATRLQQAGVNRGPLGRLLAAPVRYAGRGLQAVGTYGGEKAVAQAQNQVKNMTIDQQLNALSTATAPQRIAMLSNILKEGRINEVDPRYIARDREDEFKRYKAEKMYKEARAKHGVGWDDLQEEHERARRGVPGSRSVDEIERDMKEMATMYPKELMKTFFQDVDKLVRKLREQGKPVPAMIGDPVRIERNRQQVVQALLKFSSPGTLSSALQDVARADMLDQFGRASRDAFAAGVITAAEVNPQIVNWVENSGPRTLGVDRTFFGY